MSKRVNNKRGNRAKRRHAGSPRHKSAPVRANSCEKNALAVGRGFEKIERFIGGVAGVPKQSVRQRLLALLGR